MIILEKSDRRNLHKFLQENQISPSGYVYELPLHKQPVLSEHNQLSLPNTELLCANHICLPIFYTMTNDQVKYVSNIVKEYFLR